MTIYIRRSLPWILFAFLIVPVQAQKKGYSPGYIINSEGEMLEGWVKDRSSGSFMELYKRIRFKPDDALFKKKYSPDQILGYGLDDQHYESVALETESFFFRISYYVHEGKDRVFLRVISGNEKLTYYHLEFIDSESNYLDYIPLFHRPGSNEMLRVSQGILGLKRKRMIEYFRDCPELVQALERKELKEIDEVYNYFTEHCGRASN
jgi:hypothetical protein